MGEVKPQSNLYRGTRRSVVYGNMTDTCEGLIPELFAGLVIDAGEPGLRVWLSTSPGHARRQLIACVISDQLPMLKARNPGWHYDETFPWWDAQLLLPLEDLFRMSDHQQATYDFVASALEDLKITRTVQVLRDALTEDQLDVTS